MGMVLAGVEYFVAGLVGLVIAFLPALWSFGLFSYADGPPGREGFAIMFIYFVPVASVFPDMQL